MSQAYSLEYCSASLARERSENWPSNAILQTNVMSCIIRIEPTMMELKASSYGISDHENGSTLSLGHVPDHQLGQ